MYRKAILILFGFFIIASSVNADEAPWEPVIQVPELEQAEMQCNQYKEGNNACLHTLCLQYATVARDSVAYQMAPEEIFHNYNVQYLNCYNALNSLN